MRRVKRSGPHPPADSDRNDSMFTRLKPGFWAQEMALERLILERDAVLGELCWQWRERLLPEPRLDEALGGLALECGAPLLAAFGRGGGAARPEQVEDIRLRDHAGQLDLIVYPSFKLLVGVDGDAKAVVFLAGLAECLAVAVAVGDEDRVVDIAANDHASWRADGEVVFSRSRSAFTKREGDVYPGDRDHRPGVDVDPAALRVARERSRAREAEQRAPPVLAPDEGIGRGRERDALHMRLDGQLHATLHGPRGLPFGDGRRAAQLGEGARVGLNGRQRLGDVGVDE